LLQLSIERVFASEHVHQVVVDIHVVMHRSPVDLVSTVKDRAHARSSHNHQYQQKHRSAAHPWSWTPRASSREVLRQMRHADHHQQQRPVARKVMKNRKRVAKVPQ
jgi:hypothetical protein